MNALWCGHLLGFPPVYKRECVCVCLHALRLLLDFHFP